MRLVHLTASTFFGGPERQMLGLAKAMPGGVHTTFASFPEGGRAAAFLNEVRAAGFPALSLSRDFPRLLATLRELTGRLRDTGCDVLFCHGYKADVLGRLAARRAGIPAVAVSRGWTGESRKVKLYEWLDRRNLRFMDHVVCVSEGQAAKVRGWCGVPESRLSVIRNSARLAAFETRDPTARDRLLAFFPNPVLSPPPLRGRSAEGRVGGKLPQSITHANEPDAAPELGALSPHPPLPPHLPLKGGGEGEANPRTKPSPISHVVLAAGRLSPEKGFGLLVEAAAEICRDHPGAGVVLFGDGALRAELENRVAELGLAGRVVMPGFRTDLDSLIGAADVVVLPSFTEGLPNVALEASAAGVPVVATAVGGTPEVIRDNATGFLVPPGQPAAIAAKVGELLRAPALRERFGIAAKEYMQSTFTFEAQARAYLDLIDTLTPNPVTRLPATRKAVRTPVRTPLRRG